MARAYEVKLEHYHYGVRYLGSAPGLYFALFTNYLDVSVFLNAAQDADLITADYVERDGTVWDMDKREVRR